MTISSESVAAVRRSITLIAAGERTDFDAVFTADAINHEAASEPPGCRVPGPEGFYATALWLRTAFSDLTYEIKHAVSDGDLTAIDLMMSGRHTGPFALHKADGQIETVQTPTNRSFIVRQSHWFRIDDGRVAEHWANRDDLGQALQLGWIPPSPLRLLRNAQATRRANHPARGRQHISGSGITS